MTRRLALLPLMLALLAGALALDAHATAPPAAAQDRRDFTLINATGETIFFVWVSPSNSNDWGDDVMGSDVLLAGNSVEIVFSRRDGNANVCLYDIKVETSSGREGVLYEVNLCTTTTVTFR